VTEVDQSVRAGWRLHDDLLRAFRQAQARMGEPVVFTCTKGCSACCSEAAQASQRSQTLGVVEYRTANLVCPLLEANLCSVYDSRPLSCRAHNAAKPREFCDDVGKRKDQVFFDTREITADAVHRMAWKPGRPESQRPIFILEFALLGDWLAFFFGLIPESEVVKAQ